MKKRFMPIILALVFCFTMFSGLTVQAEELSNKVSVWCWDPSFNIYAMEKAAEYYKEDHPDFEIEITDVSYADMTQKLAAAISGGQKDSLPDILLLGDINIKKYLTVYASEEVFYPLTDSGIDFDQFAQSKLAASTFEDEIYAVPFDAGTSIALYREDLLEQAGLTYEDFTDKTWDEVIELYEEHKDEIGVPLYVDRADGLQMFNTMLTSGGSWYFDEEGNLSIKDNEVLRAAFETYKKMVDAGMLVRVSDSESYYGSFHNGSTVGGVNACWILSSVMMEESLSGKWRITNMPRYADIEGASNSGSNGGSSWLVVNNDNVEQSIDFLNETFAGSVEFYNEILPATSAIATWLPASEGSNYQEGQEFFGGQPIFADILEFTAEIPEFNFGLFSSEAADAVSVALTNYLNGADLDQVLEEADMNVGFLMGQ